MVAFSEGNKFDWLVSSCQDASEAGDRSREDRQRLEKMRLKMSQEAGDVFCWWEAGEVGSAARIKKEVSCSRLTATWRGHRGEVLVGKLDLRSLLSKKCVDKVRVVESVDNI